MTPKLAPTWIFGFGSLVWRPGFEHEGRVIGYIKDYRRVFYQGSTDHRGVPGSPGRVVTIEPSKGSTVWGAAYKLPSDPLVHKETMSALEWREKQYDQRICVDVFTPGEDDQPVVKGAMCYLASPDTTANPNYLGPASLEDIAEQIAHAVGPSGPNWEYVVELAANMRKIGAEEPELYKLDGMVRERVRGNLEVSV